MRSAFKWSLVWFFKPFRARPPKTRSLIPLKCPSVLHPSAAQRLTYHVLKLHRGIHRETPLSLAAGGGHPITSEKEFIAQRPVCHKGSASPRATVCFRSQCPCSFLGADYEPGDVIMTSAGVQ